MDKKPRWEADAERVRTAGPDWFDMERLPWWSFVLVGLAFAGPAVYTLMSDSATGSETVGAAGVLLLVAPSSFLAGWRRWRGIPLAQPWRHRDR